MGTPNKTMARMIFALLSPRAHGTGISNGKRYQARGAIPQNQGRRFA